MLKQYRFPPDLCIDHKVIESGDAGLRNHEAVRPRRASETWGSEENERQYGNDNVESSGPRSYRKIV